MQITDLLPPNSVGDLLSGVRYTSSHMESASNCKRNNLVANDVSDLTLRKAFAREESDEGFNDALSADNAALCRISSTLMKKEFAD